MGLFDRVCCRYPLPDPECQDLEYQSKDTPSQWMDNYEITPEGYLLHESYEHGADRWPGHASTENPKWVRVEYRGELEIHTILEPPDQPGRWVSYLFWFRDGRVVDMQPGTGHFRRLGDRTTVETK
jgi:hypothetical protein